MLTPSLCQLPCLHQHSFELIMQYESKSGFVVDISKNLRRDGLIIVSQSFGIILSFSLRPALPRVVLLHESPCMGRYMAPRESGLTTTTFGFFFFLLRLFHEINLPLYVNKLFMTISKNCTMQGCRNYVSFKFFLCVICRELFTDFG